MDCINYNGTWDWQGGDHCFGDNTGLALANIAFGASQSEDETFVFGGDMTPVKACGDWPFYAGDNECNSKGLDECLEPSSRAKRRRVLQFDSEVVSAPPCNEEQSFTHPRPNEMGDSVEEALCKMSHWLSDDTEGTSICGSEALDQLFEGWFSNCLSDSETKCSSVDTDVSQQSDSQNKIADHCKKPPRYEATNIQARPFRTSRNIIFKGRKSYIQTPENMASAIAYPFTFVKPCSFHGDLTLQDINQRIHAPQCLKIKEDPDPYPTSAFSGKPVVAKTRICTEGGKGSITIVRTKG